MGGKHSETRLSDAVLVVWAGPQPGMGKTGQQGGSFRLETGLWWYALSKPWHLSCDQNGNFRLRRNGISNAYATRRN